MRTKSCTWVVQVTWVLRNNFGKIVGACEDDCGRLMDVLSSLGAGLHCNSFSSRGRRQTEEVDRFKQSICAEQQQEPLERFAISVWQMITGCIAGLGGSIDTRRERSYHMFYKARIEI